MKIFNLVYKIKNPKTEKSCAVDRLKMPYILIKKVYNISSYLQICESIRMVIRTGLFEKMAQTNKAKYYEKYQLKKHLYTLS